MPPPLASIQQHSNVTNHSNTSTIVPQPLPNHLILTPHLHNHSHYIHTRPATYNLDGLNAPPPLASFSEVIKRRRRRCGGIFKPAQNSNDPFAIEYEWPYHQNRGTGGGGSERLRVDTENANREVRRREAMEWGVEDAGYGRWMRTDVDGESRWEGRLSGGRKYSFDQDAEGSEEVEASRDRVNKYSWESGAEAELGRKFSLERGANDDDECRASLLQDPNPRYSFERDVEEVDAPLRNLATRDGLSMRSLSVYSQSSGEGLPVASVVDGDKMRLGSHGSAYYNTHDISRTRTGIDKTESEYGAFAQNDAQNCGKGERSIRSISTRFGSIQESGSCISRRTHSMIESVAEKLNNFSFRNKVRNVGGEGSEQHSEGAQHRPASGASGSIQNDQNNRQFFRVEREKFPGVVKRY